MRSANMMGARMTGVASARAAKAEIENRVLSADDRGALGGGSKKTKSARSVVVARIPAENPTNPHEFFDVEVRFEQGGISYATYRRVPRGFYASVRPVTMKDGMLSYTIDFGASGRSESLFLQPAERFNAQQLSDWGAKVLDFVPFKEVLARVGVPGFVAGTGASVEAVGAGELAVSSSD